MVQAIKAAVDKEFYQGLLRGYLDSANDAIFVLCDEMKFLLCNETTEKWLGETEANLIRHNHRLPITRVLGHPDTGDLFVHHFRQALENRPGRFECLVHPPRGMERWVEFSINKVKLEGGTMVIAVGRDVTERHEALARIDYISRHDALTGLPNRSVLMDRLGQAVKRSANRNAGFGLILIDLDRFRLINDSFGRDVGDEFLVTVARWLSSEFKEGDTIARTGGSQFAIMLCDVNGPVAEVSLAVARRIAHRFNSAFSPSGHEFFSTCSIGVNIFPDGGEDATGLFRNTESALHRAKDEKGSSFRFFRQQDSDAPDSRLDFETQLRRALEREEFVLHYQPQVNIASNEVMGVEALIRWQHPDRGLVPPLEFLSAMEESGLSDKMDAWVLRTACGQVRDLITKLGRSVTLSVNISASHFADPGLRAMVKSALDESRLAPHLLELEITENTLIGNPLHTADTLRFLRALGVRVVIDDFGTGYSSLSHLRQFPVDALKIDRSFINDLTLDAGDAAIVRAIIAMSGSLGLKLVAEGIEHQAQLDTLKGYKCEFFQGFLFSRPVVIEELYELLQARGVFAPAAPN